MLPDLRTALAAERQRDLLADAHRQRLAAAVAPPAALRRTLGRLLVSLGVLISGSPHLVRPSASLMGEEERCSKSF